MIIIYQAQDVVNKVNAASGGSAFSSEVKVSKKFREGRSKEYICAFQFIDTKKTI